MTDLPQDPWRVGVNDPVHRGEADQYGGWTWREPRGLDAQMPETFRTCSYCGSIHPADITDECDLHWADFKYGWPHKLYGNMPNPDPTRLYAVSSSNRAPNSLNKYGYEWHPVGELPEGIKFEGWEGATWVGLGRRPKLHFKVYTLHLRDLLIEDEHRERIFKMGGLRLVFEFDAHNGSTVWWERYR